MVQEAPCKLVNGHTNYTLWTVFLFTFSYRYLIFPQKDIGPKRGLWSFQQKKDLFRPHSRLTQQNPVIGRRDIEVPTSFPKTTRSTNLYYIFMHLNI